tara:strand:+ start:57624 stop:58757 length:1134 start_codon:yes stop_codon:yes gene_type:complete
MKFIEDFNPEIIVESPGRINLIGEHTDYNLGLVLPTAIDKKITLKLRKNGDLTSCKIYSVNNNQILELCLEKIEKSDINWENYILGVLDELQKLNCSITGFDCIIQSDLPIGSGLSSSAALECGLASGLNTLFNLKLSKNTIVTLSRAAEHNFVGTKCGIMDQYASVMSRSGFVIMLDCRNLEANFIPLNLNDYQLLLLNTNVSHSLADSEYNTRLYDCEAGLKIIQKNYPNIQSLRDVSFDMLRASKEIMSTTIYGRCEYILEENARVVEASKALKNNDLELLGKLIYDSHEGLQYKYEVSCSELDFLVEFSRDKNYILGSRMMGGGFGGCTINLIHKDAIPSYKSEVSKAYQQKFNLNLDIYTAMPSEGTKIKIV